jgi:hypothetical protein
MGAQGVLNRQKWRFSARAVRWLCDARAQFKRQAYGEAVAGLFCPEAVQGGESRPIT